MLLTPSINEAYTVLLKMAQAWQFPFWKAAGAMPLLGLTNILVVTLYIF